MARINPYDKYREQIAAWNAANPRYQIVQDCLTKTQQPAARPFVLYRKLNSGVIDYVARYSTIETAMKAGEKDPRW